ncbi:NADP-dependent oxidoreductase [Gordonia zhaorongruii]|uniref:NADP-dependent oxidoreductase n=1 Tax=Gordonia zhaorongruii TaxID=2597659 RepID=UPI001049EF2F|nr:NADP-dependent oxidoreductase [Gordonia zhaorongruii]
MAQKIVATGYGAPREVLSIADVEEPVPGPGQVVVEVRAAGLNPFDVKKVQGAMGSDPSALPLALGGEAAGVIRSADDDSGFAPGDEVVVYPASGAFAEFVSADTKNVHTKPSGAPFDAAAGLLLAGVTAFDTVATLGLGADDTVLIHGGSGSVGSVAIVLAISRGARVIATASPGNHEHVRDLGAVPVAYGDGLVDAVRSAAPSPVTAVIDTAGSDEAIDASLEFVEPARIVSIAAFGRADDGIVLLNGSSEQSKKNRSAAAEPLLTALADGEISVDIAGSFAFADAADAFEALDGNHPRGKFILHP